VRRFPLTCTLCSAEAPPRDAGMLPVNLLSLRPRKLSWRREPSHVGIAPASSLTASESTRRPVERDRSGRGPWGSLGSCGAASRWFPLRSSTWRDVSEDREREGAGETVAGEREHSEETQRREGVGEGALQAIEAEVEVTQACEVGQGEAWEGATENVGAQGEGGEGPQAAEGLGTGPARPHEARASAVTRPCVQSRCGHGVAAGVGGVVPLLECGLCEGQGLRLLGSHCRQEGHLHLQQGCLVL